MTKAKRIRLAAAVAAAQEGYRASKSPLAFSILGQQLKMLRDEEKLLSASLQRLKAERKLAEMRESYELVKESFAVSMRAREEAAVDARVDEAVSSVDAGGYRADALLSDDAPSQLPEGNGGDNGNGSSTRKDMDGLHEEMMATVVDGDLLGLPATADAEAAGGHVRGAPASTATGAGGGKPKRAARAGKRPRATTTATATATAAARTASPKKRAGAASTAAKEEKATTRKKPDSPSAKTRKGSAKVCGGKQKATRKATAAGVKPKPKTAPNPKKAGTPAKLNRGKKKGAAQSTNSGKRKAKAKTGK